METAGLDRSVSNWELTTCKWQVASEAGWGGGGGPCGTKPLTCGFVLTLGS